MTKLPVSARFSRMRSRLVRPSVSWLSALVMLTSLLAAVPAAAQAEEPEPREIELAPAQPMPEPLGLQDRMPRSVEISQPGFDQVTREAITFSDEAAAEEIVSDLVRTGREGEVDFYAEGQNRPSHIAVVAPGPDSLPVLERSGEGWTGSFENATVFLPRQLSSSAPVTYTVGASTLSLSPLAAESQPLGLEKVTGQEADDRKIVYQDVRTGVDYVYFLVQGGFEEDTIFRTPAAATSTLTWRASLNGLSLSLNEGGGVSISDVSGLVAEIPAPVATDAAGESSTGTYGLSELSNGDTKITLSLDEAFLAEATYPVTVDPGASTLHPARDAFVDQEFPNTEYGNTTNLKVKSNANRTRRSFIHFDVDSLVASDRLVYQADLKLRNIDRDAGTSVEAMPITSAWPSQLNWNSQPSAGSTIDTEQNGSGALWTWDVKSLYQSYLDGTDANRYGVRLSSTGGEARWYSSEVGGVDRPDLVVSYNDLPDVATYRSPDEGVVESENVGLRIDAIPSDPNGDPVLVRYQVSTSQSDFTGSHLVAESGWTSQRTWFVTPGKLVNGSTYYWRVQSADVCSGTSVLCSLVDGAGVTHTQPATAPRQLTLSVPKLGMDERYPLWSQELGNNMMLSVNEANGNLVLDMPFDTRQVRSGDVEFGLTYNSRDVADEGLGAGWNLHAGPAGVDMPYRVKEINPAPDSGLRMYFDSGEKAYFLLRDVASDSYLSLGAGTGRVDRTEAGTYVYEPADGGTYTFDSSGKLATVRFPGTKVSAAATGDVLSYTYDAYGHLTQVSYNGGQAITFTWTAGSSGVLDTVSTWDGASFDVTVDSGKIRVTNPAGETYEAKRTGSAVYEIRDGEVYDRGNTGWLITYDASGHVISAKAPGASDAYTLEYAGPFFGDTASVTYLTDPRGQGTSDPNDFRTMIEPDTTGLPIRVTGPADQTGYLPVVTRYWDTNKNLVCERSAEANAYSLISDPQQCNDAANLSSTYTYDSTGPYVVTEADQGVSAQGAGDVADTDVDYDTGVSGPRFTTYDTSDMSGPPVDAGFWSDPLTASHGAGGPAGVTDNDSFSIVFDGYLTNTGPADKTYKFRIYSNDGSRLTVSDTVLTDCYGQAQLSTSYNCGTNQDVSITLGTGLTPIQIRYSELTGSANFDIQWNGGSGSTFTTMNGTDLTSEAGILTDVTSPEVKDETIADGPTRLDTDESYAGADAKITHLATTTTETDLDSARQRIETSVYDNYGRLTSDTQGSGTSDAATTTFSYATTSRCVTEELGPIAGMDTDRTCNARGQVTSETLHVRATYDQPAQDRTTTYTYDGMGRVLTEDTPGAGIKTYTYDDAGESETEDVLLSGTTHAITTHTYNDAGQETSTQGPGSDVVNFTFDKAGNRITESDPRNSSWVTTRVFDAHNREIQVTTPSGLVSTTQHVLKESGNYVNETREISPAGVTTTTTLDLRSQETSVKRGSLGATTYGYDESGNTTSTDDPGADAVNETSNAFSDTTQATAPDPGPGDAVTTFTYDALGRQTAVNGPRTDADDRFVMTYDAAGNLSSVQQAGLATPNTTNYAYDDAGELVRVAQPLDAGTTFVRTFTYDVAGNQTAITDSRGTVQNTYDAGGRLVSETLPNGVQKDHTYDVDGNETTLAATKTGFGTATRSFGYDEAAHLTSASQGLQVVNLTYDSDGRLTGATTNTGANSTRSYNATTGKVSSVTTPAGTTTFSWNADGLIASATDPFTNQPTTYTWNSAGQLTGRTDPAGLTWASSYDSAGRVDTQTISNTTGQVASFDLGYDPAGNVTSRQEIVKKPDGTNLPGSGTWTYGYDPANRMISATDPSSTVTTYGYDRAGNRTSVKIGAAAEVTTTFDAASLPVSSSDGTTYTYDAMGTLIAVDKSGGATGDQCYAYDGFGLVASMKKDSTTGCSASSGDVTYAYDALARTLTRTEGSDTTTFAYELDGEDLAREVVGSQTTLYANSPEAPLASSTGGQARFFLKDLHGDVVGTANTSGAVAGSKLYSPWGEPVASAGESVSLGFQSQITDADTGFVDMTTRLYDPTVGRFTSRDVLFGETTSPASMNQYGYAEGNPIAWSDPSGLARVYHHGWVRAEVQEYVNIVVNTVKVDYYYWRNSLGLVKGTGKAERHWVDVPGLWTMRREQFSAHNTKGTYVWAYARVHFHSDVFPRPDYDLAAEFRADPGPRGICTLTDGNLPLGWGTDCDYGIYY